MLLKVRLNKYSWVNVKFSGKIGLIGLNLIHCLDKRINELSNVHVKHCLCEKEYHANVVFSTELSTFAFIPIDIYIYKWEPSLIQPKVEMEILPKPIIIHMFQQQ